MLDRIYIAASYPAHKLAKEVANKIKQSGFAEIVSTWHDYPRNENKITELNKYIDAIDCKKQIRDCDCLLYLSTPDPSKGGKDYELGLASGMHKKIIYIGKQTHIFTTLYNNTDFLPYTLIEDIKSIVERYVTSQENIS